MLKPFRFHSQKVLPLVYDDSLSYYEVLGKISHKLNEVIHVVENYTTEEIDRIVEEKFNDIMFNAVYDAETETIIIGVGGTESNG